MYSKMAKKVIVGPFLRKAEICFSNFDKISETNLMITISCNIKIIRLIRFYNYNYFYSVIRFLYLNF